MAETVLIPKLGLFQSSPTPKGGRYVHRPMVRKATFRVSILAHPERWALRRSVGSFSEFKRFQSSPTPKGGRYVKQGYPIRLSTVSILAHPERWALPQLGNCLRFFLMFQSSPTPKGGRYVQGP